MDIAHPDPRHIGLAAVTTAATVEHALAAGLTDIWWICDVNNVGSVKTAVNLGFTEQFQNNSFFFILDEVEHRRQFMHRLFVLTLFILLFAATGCTNSLTETDTAVPLEVPAGETFDIVLAANMTTGYEWRLAEPLDESVVQFVGQEYKSEQSNSEGGGGHDIWTFRAIAPGTTEIVLGYYPPDGSDIADQITTFTLIVE